eukprot:91151_1
MGWNTWCSIDKCGTDICNQWQIVQVAQAMKSNGMYDLGYDRVNMDDCWEDCERSSSGAIQSDPERFPDGIKSLANTLHDLGFKFGLYTSAGSTTCNAGTRSCPGGVKPPGSFGHYANDTATFAEWGVDYIKIDWCGKDTTDAKKQHTEFSNYLNATGRPIWLELCRGYTYPAPEYVAEVANSWRVTEDHHDDWKSTANAIARTANATNLSGPYNWAYSDFLMTGGQGCSGDRNPNKTHAHCAGMTDIEYRTEYTMWSIISSPLLVATDLRNMTDIMKSVLLNKEVIAVNQNNGYDAGNMIPSQTKRDAQVWAKQIGDTSSAIVLYNTGDSSSDITVHFSSVPHMKWDSKSELKLRDLWKQHDLGSYTGGYVGVQVPSHGVMLLSATSA